VHVRNRRSHRPEVEPLEADAVLVLGIGTVLWAVAFVGLLPFKATLRAHDASWWLWVCVAGVALGLLGMRVASRQRDRLRAAARSPVPDPPPPPDSGLDSHH
jgi:NO-binding membrane sensor protein with MHYT domain